MSEMSSAAVTAEPARHSTGRWSFNSSKGARHGQSREFGAAPWRVPVHSQQCSLRSNKYVRPRLARFLTGLFAIALLLSAAGPGFRSRRQLDEHYAKHGAEFGRISEHEYLRLAQELRDAVVRVLWPAGQYVLAGMLLPVPGSAQALVGAKTSTRKLHHRVSRR